jgi:hypothetical protein
LNQDRSINYLFIEICRDIAIPLLDLFNSFSSLFLSSIEYALRQKGVDILSRNIGSLNRMLNRHSLVNGHHMADASAKRDD